MTKWHWLLIHEFAIFLIVTHQCAIVYGFKAATLRSSQSLSLTRHVVGECNDEIYFNHAYRQFNKYHYDFLSSSSTRSRNNNHNLSLMASTSSFTSVSNPMTSSPNNSLINVAAVIGGALILSIYHFNLYHNEKKGLKTWRSEQAKNREMWSQYVRESEGWLYAIQTLRNAITAQTFLSTTVLSLLTVITGRIWDIVRQMDRACPYRKYLVTQFIVIVSCMLTSSYHFLQSARLMTHAGFMFPIDKTTKVDKIMRKTQNSQWLGLRWLYISATTIAWLVGGPKIFFTFSSLLIAFLRKIDKVPDEIDS